MLFSLPISKTLEASFPLSILVKKKTAVNKKHIIMQVLLIFLDEQRREMPKYEKIHSILESEAFPL